MYNHLVLGQERQGSTRTYIPPTFTATLHNSMTIGWKPLEIIPKSVRWRDWPRRHSLLGWYLALCEPRRIDDGSRIHYSVFERFDADPTYRPPNLPPSECVQIEGPALSGALSTS
jgi:hypothetical protein